MSLQEVALGVAVGDADHKVREVGGNNRGPRIKQYLQNLDPPFAEGAAWCAAAVQYWADAAARACGVPNPLDRVRQEALVQSYYDLLHGDLVQPEEAAAGDLVLFKFPRNGVPAPNWNHIGLLAQPPKVGSSTFWTVEGNTGDVDQRDGDGVYLKPRELGRYPVSFIAWGRVRETE